MQEIERHIFIDTHSYFLEKKLLFEELYVDSIIAIASTDSTKSLLELDYSISESLSEEEFAEILISLTFNKPSILIQSLSNKKHKSDYSIYKLSEEYFFDQMISIETISNYNDMGKTACKIYQIFPADLISVNNHWL